MLKWENDQKIGVLGWDAPTKKGRTEQPRYRDDEKTGFTARVDIDAVFADPVVEGVLDRWSTVRQYFPDGAPAYSGGLLDAWPAIDVDAFVICYSEEEAIQRLVTWKADNHV